MDGDGRFDDVTTTHTFYDCENIDCLRSLTEPVTIFDESYDDPDRDPVYCERCQAEASAPEGW